MPLLLFAACSVLLLLCSVMPYQRSLITGRPLRRVYQGAQNRDNWGTKSYNEHDYVLMRPPFESPYGKVVQIDAPLADLIADLWKHKIETGNCCQGSPHNIYSPYGYLTLPVKEWPMNVIEIGNLVSSHVRIVITAFDSHSVGSTYNFGFALV